MLACVSVEAHCYYVLTDQLPEEGLHRPCTLYMINFVAPTKYMKIHNIPVIQQHREDFFREKPAASGGIRTCDTLLSRLSALQTELLR